MTARIPLVINSGAIQELQSGDSFNLGTGATLVSPVITGTGTAIFSQVNIVGQGDVRFEDASGGQYVAFQAPATIPTSYTLTWPDTDGSAGQALVTDGTGVLSWSTAAAGDVYGPASATDNAVARFDGTTGKLIQNSVMTIADDGASVLSVNSASDGLRITQVGAGNALVVEDSANPDATPFVVDAQGNVGIGETSPSTYITNGIVLKSSIQFNPAILSWNKSNDATPSLLLSRKDRAGAIVQSGDELYRIFANGYDGASYLSAASISAWVDGTPGTNDMPGRLVFSTTADGASSPTERMRIDSAGRVGIGGTASGGQSVSMFKNLTGGTNVSGYLSNQQIQSDATNIAALFSSNPSTAAASFTLANLHHYRTSQGTFGAGSTVTTQIGFIAESNLIGATSNYGFYSSIASGTGRYNFYAAGTASNYFAGKVGFSYTPPGTNANFFQAGFGTDAISYGTLSTVTIPVSASTRANINHTWLYTASNGGTPYTISALSHYGTQQVSIHADSTVSAQYGFEASSSLTGATNNYGFYSNIASGTGRYNFYAAGSADNFFSGPVGINGTPSAKLDVHAPTLGSNSGDSSTGTNFWFADGNGTKLVFSSYRTSAGSNHSTSMDKIQRVVDVTAMGYIGFGSNYISFGQGTTEQMRIDSTGDVLINTTASIPGAFSDTGRLQIAQNTGEAVQQNFAFTNAAGGSYLYLNKSRSGTIGTNTIVQNNDIIGGFAFAGADGVTYHRAAAINVEVDGTPGVNDMPGRLLFFTTPDGSTSPTERMRIDNAGRVGIGGSPSSGQRIVISGGQSLGANPQFLLNQQGVQSDATGVTTYFDTYVNLQATAFTVTTLNHYRSVQAALSGGAAITNQRGFSAESSLTGATNNYGFYSNIASGTGRYNFYAAGTANNYFAGRVGIGETPNVDVSLVISRPLSGATSFFQQINAGSIQSDVTSAAVMFGTYPTTAAAAFTLGSLHHFQTGQGTIGSGSTVTNQYGFNAQSSLTGATNNYGFYSGIASGTGRYNFYAGGSADNYFAGKVGIGTASPAVNLHVVGAAYIESTSGFGQLEMGGPSGAYIDMKSPFSDDFDFRLQTDGSVAYIVAGGVPLTFSTNGSERLRIDTSGNVLVTGAGGLGYGTGSGGAVTQTTSRTTGVTLNKTNGAITLVSAAGSATTQSFTVTNSTVAATDTIIVNQKSGTDLYEVFITAVSAGSFRITFATTGGTTTEQPVFNFAVIKAVTA